jgi:hypothetical protein
VHFENIEWASLGAGARCKRYVAGDQIVRLVEFSEGFLEEDYCQNGHAGYVIGGSFCIEYGGVIERYTMGDTFLIKKGEQDKHKAILGTGEKVLLLLFERQDQGVAKVGEEDRSRASNAPPPLHPESGREHPR